MSKAQTIATWLNITLSALRRDQGMSSGEFAPFVQKNGIVRFLVKNYELLHYYDTRHVIGDILRHIAGRAAGARQQG